MADEAPTTNPYSTRNSDSQPYAPQNAPRLFSEDDSQLAGFGQSPVNFMARPDFYAAQIAIRAKSVKFLNKQKLNDVLGPAVEKRLNRGQLQNAFWLLRINSQVIAEEERIRQAENDLMEAEEISQRLVEDQLAREQMQRDSEALLESQRQKSLETQRNKRHIQDKKNRQVISIQRAIQRDNLVELSQVMEDFEGLSWSINGVTKKITNSKKKKFTIVGYAINCGASKVIKSILVLGGIEINPLLADACSRLVVLTPSEYNIATKLQEIISLLISAEGDVSQAGGKADSKVALLQQLIDSLGRQNAGADAKKSPKKKNSKQRSPAKAASDNNSDLPMPKAGSDTRQRAIIDCIKQFIMRQVLCYEESAKEVREVQGDAAYGDDNELAILADMDLPGRDHEDDLSRRGRYSILHSGFGQRSEHVITYCLREKNHLALDTILSAVQLGEAGERVIGLDPQDVLRAIASWVRPDIDVGNRDQLPWLLGDILNGSMSGYARSMLSNVVRFSIDILKEQEAEQQWHNLIREIPTREAGLRARNLVVEANAHDESEDDYSLEDEGEKMRELSLGSANENNSSSELDVNAGLNVSLEHRESTLADKEVSARWIALGIEVSRYIGNIKEIPDFVQSFIADNSSIMMSDIVGSRKYSLEYLCYQQALEMDSSSIDAWEHLVQYQEHQLKSASDELARAEAVSDEAPVLDQEFVDILRAAVTCSSKALLGALLGCLDALYASMGIDDKAHYNWNIENSSPEKASAAEEYGDEQLGIIAKYNKYLPRMAKLLPLFADSQKGLDLEAGVVSSCLFNMLQLYDLMSTGSYELAIKLFVDDMDDEEKVKLDDMDDEEEVKLYVMKMIALIYARKSELDSHAVAIKSVDDVHASTSGHRDENSIISVADYDGSVRHLSEEEVALASLAALGEVGEQKGEEEDNSHQVVDRDLNSVSVKDLDNVNPIVFHVLHDLAKMIDGGRFRRSSTDGALVDAIPYYYCRFVESFFDGLTISSRIPAQQLSFYCHLVISASACSIWRKSIPHIAGALASHTVPFDKDGNKIFIHGQVDEGGGYDVSSQDSESSCQGSEHNDFIDVQNQQALNILVQILEDNESYYPAYLMLAHVCYEIVVLSLDIDFDNKQVEFLKVLLGLEKIVNPPLMMIASQLVHKAVDSLQSYMREGASQDSGHQLNVDRGMMFSALGILCKIVFPPISEVITACRKSVVGMFDSAIDGLGSCGFVPVNYHRDILQLEDWRSVLMTNHAGEKNNPNYGRNNPLTLNETMLDRAMKSGGVVGAVAWHCVSYVLRMLRNDIQYPPMVAQELEGFAHLPVPEQSIMLSKKALECNPYDKHLLRDMFEQLRNLQAPSYQANISELFPGGTFAYCLDLLIKLSLIATSGYNQALVFLQIADYIATIKVAGVEMPEDSCLTLDELLGGRDNRGEYIKLLKSKAREICPEAVADSQRRKLSRAAGGSLPGGERLADVPVKHVGVYSLSDDGGALNPLDVSTPGSTGGGIDLVSVVRAVEGATRDAAPGSTRIMIKPARDSQVDYDGVKDMINIIRGMTEGDFIVREEVVDELYLKTLMHLLDFSMRIHKSRTFYNRVLKDLGANKLARMDNVISKIYIAYPEFYERCDGNAQNCHFLRVGDRLITGGSGFKIEDVELLEQAFSAIYQCDTDIGDEFRGQFQENSGSSVTERRRCTLAANYYMYVSEGAIEHVEALARVADLFATEKLDANYGLVQVNFSQRSCVQRAIDVFIDLLGSMDYEYVGIVFFRILTNLANLIDRVGLLIDQKEKLSTLLGLPVAAASQVSDRFIAYRAIWFSYQSLSEQEREFCSEFIASLGDNTFQEKLLQLLSKMLDEAAQLRDALLLVFHDVVDFLMSYSASASKLADDTSSDSRRALACEEKIPDDVGGHAVEDLLGDAKRVFDGFVGAHNSLVDYAIAFSQKIIELAPQEVEHKSDHAGYLFNAGRLDDSLDISRQLLRCGHEDLQLQACLYIVAIAYHRKVEDGLDVLVKSDFDLSGDSGECVVAEDMGEVNFTPDSLVVAVLRRANVESAVRQEKHTPGAEFVLRMLINLVEAGHYLESGKNKNEMLLGLYCMIRVICPEDKFASRKCEVLTSVMDSLRARQPDNAEEEKEVVRGRDAILRSSS